MYAHSEDLNNVKEALMSFDSKLAQQITVGNYDVDNLQSIDDRFKN